MSNQDYYGSSNHGAPYGGQSYSAPYGQSSGGAPYGQSSGGAPYGGQQPTYAGNNGAPYGGQDSYNHQQPQVSSPSILATFCLHLY